MSIVIINNNRSEAGPLTSVIAALPEARVVGLSALQQKGSPAQVMSFGLWWFNREFEENRPKLVIVLGDRYETLAAAQAALFLRIPVAHIHGGETTTGAWDDSIRHAITHIAQLHFVATHDAAVRVMRLNGCSITGWEFNHEAGGVYISGAPGLDGVKPHSARRDLAEILVTFHPETRAPDYGLAACNAMLAALEPYTQTHTIVFCGVNNDTGHNEIRTAQWAFACKHDCDWATMDHAAYIARLQHAALVIGNSSAGIIEAPWIGVPTVNIGDRQLGREMSTSVFQNDFSISCAIKAALSWNGPWDPCYRGEAAPRIAEVVREFVGYTETALVGV